MKSIIWTAVFIFTVGLLFGCTPPEEDEDEGESVDIVDAGDNDDTGDGDGDNGDAGDPMTNTLNAQSPLGTNLPWILHNEASWPLLDEMKRSFVWGTSNDKSCDPDLRDKLNLDEQGWLISQPESDNFTCTVVSIGMLFGGKGHYPTGKYTVLYEGEGLLDYDGATKIEEESSPGRDVVEVTNPTDNGIWVSIMNTDPNNTGDYLRNIRFIHPGGLCNNDPFTYHPDDSTCQGKDDTYTPFEEVYETQRFHPLYLQDLRKYRALRFLNYFYINENHEPYTWETRPQLTDAVWSTTKGTPVELAIELSNKLNADAWLHIPFWATDDYIRKFALLAKNTLKKNLKVYLEYQNEIAGTAEPFATAGNWVEAKGVEQWPDAEVDNFTKRLNWYGKRVSEICATWKDTFGNESNRVQCVMGGHPYSPYSQIPLECPLWAAENGGTPCAANTDHLAISMYFGYYMTLQHHQAKIAEWLDDDDGGLDKLFQELRYGGLLYDSSHEDPAPQNGDLEAMKEWIENNRNLAVVQKYNISIVAYEGGQHLFHLDNLGYESDPRIGELFDKANEDPRMAEMYTEVLNLWKAQGGTLFNHFQYIQDNSFGLRRYQTQDPPPPKYNAVMDFIDNNPCWWEGCTQ